MKNSQRGNLQPRSFHMEHLEQRHLLSAVPFGSGTVNDADDGATVLLTLSSSNAPAGTTAVVQIRVEAAGGSALDPGQLQLVNAQNGEILFSHLNFEGTSSYALASLVLNQEYELLVQSEGGTTGDYNIYVQLAGDTNGDNTVSELEWRSAEAAVLQSNGFSSGLANSWRIAYGIDLYKNDYYRAEFDTNSNNRIDASELLAIITPNFYLTTQDGITIDDMEVVTDNAPPELSDVRIFDGNDESVDTPAGDLGAWNGPWDEAQRTDRVTSAAVNAADGFIITGKIYDQSDIASATGKFSFNGQEVTIPDMLQNQGDYYTYDADTGVFTLDVGKALGIATGTFAEGEYVLEMWATDAYGNKHTTGEPSTVTVVIDRTAPEFTLELVADAVQNTVPSRVEFDKENAVEGDYVQIWRSGDSGRVLLGTAKLTATDIVNGYIDVEVAAVPDGSYTFYVRAIDLAGNFSEGYVVETTVRLDTTKPGLGALTENAAPRDYPGAVDPGMKYTLDGTADLSIAATDEDLSALTYVLWHNGVATGAVYNDGKFEGVSLVYGKNEFYVIVTDAAGNFSKSDTVSVLKNDLPAVVEENRIESHTQAMKEDDENSNTWTVDLTDNPLFTDVNIADGDGLAFSYSVTGSAVKSVTITGTTLTVVFNNIPDGEIRLTGEITLTATDKDGETAEMTFDVVYTKDDIAPAVDNIELSPGGFRDDTDNNTYYTPGEDGSFIINGVIYDVSDILEIEGALYYQGQKFDITDLLTDKPSGTPITIDVLALLNANGAGLTELADGEYVLKIWGVDSVGNTSSEENPSVEYTFVLDTAAPEAMVDSLSSPLYTNDNTPEITVKLDTAENGLSGFWVEIVGTGPTAVYAVIPASAFVNGEYKFSPETALADGEYSFTARTVDAAGNATADCTAEEVIVDTVAPVVEVVAPSATVKPGMDYPNYTNDGTTDITVYIDELNPTQYLLYAVEGDDKTLLEDTGATIADKDYTFGDGAPFTLRYGANVFTVVLIDEAGNESEPFTFTVTHNKPPAIVGGEMENLTISGNETYTMEIDIHDLFSDEEADKLTYEVSVPDQGGLLVSKVYNAETGILTLVFKEMQPGDEAAVVTVSVTATDIYGEVTGGSFTATCSLGNTPPKWVNGNTLETGMFYTGQTEKSLTFNPGALITDAETPGELTFEDIEIAFGGETYTVGDGITDNGDGTYTWTPPVNYYGGGMLSITVTDEATNDGEGENAAQTVTLTKAILVQWENYAPVLSLVGGAEAEADIKLVRDGSVDLADIFEFSDIRGTYTGTGYGTDPGAGQTYTWSISGGGDAVTLEGSVLSYDFTSTDWGVKTVQVKVNDTAGDSNGMTFTLNVYAVNHAPEGTADTVSYQVTGEHSQTWDLTANDTQTKDTWQDVHVEKVTVNGVEIDRGESQTVTVTHNSEEYVLTFSLSNDGKLTLTVPGSVTLAELEGLEIGFSYLLQDDGAFPSGYPFAEWADGTDDTDFAAATVTGNTIQFNAYASALTYSDFVANLGEDASPAITDILTRNAGNWGDKTFVLQTGGVFDIYQDGVKAGEAVVLANGTLEIRLPGNAFGQYTLDYVLVNTAEPSETAAAKLTLNVTATNAEAPVYTGNADALKFTINEGSTREITLAYLDSLFSDYETPGQFTYSFTCSQGTFALNAEETAYVFTPNAGLYDVAITFTVTATDTAFGVSGNMAGTKTSAAVSGAITVNPVVAAPTVDSSEVIVVTESSKTIDLKDYITNYDDSLTYTYTVNDSGLSGTLVKQSEGVYVFTPADGSFGSESFTFNVTVSKGTASASANNNTVNIVVAGTVHVTDKSLEVIVDSSSKSYARNETLTDAIYLDGTNSVSGLITINAGSKLLAGTMFTLSSSNYSEDEIAEMMQGLLYTRNGDVFTITAECTVVNDWGVEARNNTFVDGVQFSAGTTFGAATMLNIKTYSLNTDLYANPDAYLVMTDDSLTGVTAVNYTLKENSFIDRIEVVGGQLVIHYNVYSPTQDRTAQDITVTVGGVQIPMQITIDYVQPLEYYVRVVKESDYVSSDNGGYKTSELYAQNSINVAPGEKIYVEVWFQNDLPIITSLLYSQYKTWKQEDFLGLLATQLVGINFDDMVFSYPNGGYAGEFSTWSQDRAVTETENGFFAGDMASMIMLTLIEVLGSGSDGTYARIGVLAIELPEGQEGVITFEPFTDGSVDYNTSLQIFAKDGIEESAGLELMNGWYNQAQVKHNSFTVTVTNSAKIYGTESARETVVEGTGVYMTVSKEATADTQVDELPASEQWLTEWDSYYVNLWVNTQDPNVNLESLLFDLTYNAKYATATGIEYTGAINGLEVMYSADGAVIGIGGTLLADLTTSDGFVLIGRVKMESLSGDNIAADTVGSVKTGLALDNIRLTDSTGEAVTPNTQVFVNTNVYAVVYDINDDGMIDVYDLIQFAKNYGDSSVDSLNPVTWAIDFDNSGMIDVYDLIQFAKNYGAGQENGRAVAYPEGFMQRWIGSQFLTEGDASVSEMLDVVIRQWQDALGEEFQIDVQIIVKDIGDSTLGESVLVSLDEDGKPAVAVIYLDASALGLGWYVSEDATQLAESGRYDLYTVLLHELGHALGFNPLYTGFLETLEGNGQWYVADDGSVYVMMSGSDHFLLEDDLMYYQIAPGVRKEISSLDAEIVSKARENGGELVYIEKITILGETAADGQAAMTVAMVSAIVDEAQWTRTLEEKVVAEIQREAQQLTAAAILAEDDDALAVTPAAEADAVDWLELTAAAAVPVVASPEAAADLLLGDWESFLENGEDGEEADDLPLTLDAE